ncbi:MAG: YqgE/AlgH family protein [Opitutaceae bacterium]|nr:YqgE/AlgH family protein [Opitutaceae bacterium]
MRERDQVTSSLAGQLLLAHPAMHDPNFRRSVVLLSVHGDDGAMGVVLNRPLGKQLGDLNAEFAASTLAGVPVYQGGPVQTEQLILAAWQPEPLEASFKLYFGIDVDKAEALQGNEGVRLRAFLGYSGWTKGQLENELRHHTWVVTPVSPELLERREGQELWRAILGRLSPEWKLMADEPDDLGTN